MSSREFETNLVPALGQRESRAVPVAGRLRQTT
jgi:hypothetical protein